jgi:PAS domain S-box-containing protein
LRSIRQYFVTVALLLVLLILGATAVILYEVDRSGRIQSERQLLATTRAVSLVVDGELKRYEAVLRVLRTSDSLARRDWASFERRTGNLLAGPNAWIVLRDRNGRELANTGPSAGTAQAAAKRPELPRELDAGRSRICDLGGRAAEPGFLCVELPVMRQGRAELILSIVMRPAQLTTIIDQQRLQQGSFATIVDRRGIVVWRNALPERFIGRPASADIRAALARSGEGVRDSYSLEGVPTVAAFSRSSLSGWTFIIAVPRAAMRAGTTQALIMAAGGAALFLLAGALVGAIAARRVTRAVSNLALSAEQIQQGEMPHYPPTGLAEIDTAGRALEEALQARRLSEDRYRLIFEQTSDLILTADLNQVITDCNPSAAAAVGLPRDQAIGRNIEEFVSPDDFARTTEMLRQKLSAGGTTRYDVRVRSSTGELLFWEINSGLTFRRDGTPLGLHVVGRDITERRRSEDRQRLLINELNHRVKNTLAIVQALAQQSFKGIAAAQEERAAFDARLATLAAAHNLLTHQAWEKVDLSQVVEAAIDAACGLDPKRHVIEGPQVTLAPQTAVSIAMAIHELCTNAIKYGALSTDAGTIVTRWTVEEGQGGSRLRFEWIERGGPPVRPPAQRGFGTRMIERGLAAELQADVRMDFQREGLVFVLDAPLPAADE